MSNSLFRLSLDRGVSFPSAERTVILAALAGEALFGEATVAIDFGYRCDEQERTILIDGSTPAGSAIAKIALHLLRREFGDAVHIERLPLPAPKSQAVVR